MSHNKQYLSLSLLGLVVVLLLYQHEVYMQTMPLIFEVEGCKFTYFDESNNILVPNVTNQAPFQANQSNHQQSTMANLSTHSNNSKSTDHSTVRFAASQPQQQQQQQQQVNSPSSPSVILFGLGPSIGLECQAINAEQLHEQFHYIESTGQHITSLIVKDSNLSALANLPQGSHELHRMIISNTSIDLEVLKEGSESLNNLTILEIRNEKISNIPQNFFQEMQSLKELRLDNDEIASLDGDAFHNLDDSLEILCLRNNRFNRFPMAVKNLAQLAVLDLSDNDIVIDTQENDLPEKLEPLLNLRELAMNRINCSCEFSSSPFFEWIARTHISGVRCSSPAHLRGQEIIVFERDEFCVRSSSSSSTPRASSNCSTMICHIVLSLLYAAICFRFIQLYSFAI